MRTRTFALLPLLLCGLLATRASAQPADTVYLRGAIYTANFVASFTGDGAYNSEDVYLVEADIARWKRVIGDGLRFQTDGRQAIEVALPPMC